MDSLHTQPEECPHIIIVQFWASHLHTHKPNCATTFEQFHVPAWQALAAYAKRFRPGFFVWLGPGREGNFSFEWHGQWEPRALVIRATLAKSGHPILNPASHFANMFFRSSTQNTHFNRHPQTITGMVKLVCRTCTFC